MEDPTGNAIGPDAPVHPGVRFPPPLIVLGFILAGWGVEKWVPLRAIQAATGQVLFYPGLILALVALGTLVATSQLFKRAGTSIKPWKPSTAMLDGGLYAYSRNPIYVCFALVHAGTAMMASSIWIAATIPLSVLTLRYYVIAREERYLTHRFGEGYRQYQNRVRRWL